ncbi:MAG TPA: nuclear transport factor 2 family protein [Mycobacterium sp.]|nr:nuclear transport factor 2 family protein [Mycobacterium sp.]
MDDYEEIRRVVALHAQLLDERRWTELAALFCTDGVLPWGGKTYRGRKEIIEGLPGTQPEIPHRIKHFVYAPVIEIDGDEARAWSDVIVSLVPEAGPAEMSFVGRYHDHLCRQNGRWLLFKHITVKTGDPLPDDERLPNATD